MRKFNCSGMPFEIGVQHGRQAREEIHGSLAFYTELYQRKSKMDWNTTSHCAEEFIPVLEKDWPDYVEEIKGVREGSDLPFTTILAMNIRTEISMGMFSDGCTSFVWKTDDVSLLAQNWDNGKPSISMIIEAGLIGKIGMNSAGVGVCLNAIRARGVDYGRLPVHLALRATLDSNSRLEAIAKLEKAGVAAAAHLLIADSTGTTSIEFSHRDLVKIGTSDGRICHSNHFLVEHADGVSETVFGQDSRDRMVKATKLLQGAAEREKPPTVQTIQKMLEDEEGYPGAINRAALGASSTATLFGIVMELKSKTAKVRIGRPTQCKGTMLLRPPGV